MPSMADFSESHNVPSAENNLIFPAEVPALGFAYFHIEKLAERQPEVSQVDKQKPNQQLDNLRYYGTKVQNKQIKQLPK